MKAGEYESAAKEYGYAYSITKDPVLFYRIARAHHENGDCKTALVYYGRYLKEAKPNEEFQKLTEAEIAECKATLGPEPTEPDGGEPASGTLEPDLSAEDPAPPSGDTYVVVRPVIEHENPDGQWFRTAGWVSVGLAGVLLTTGTILGLRARDRQDKIDELFADPDTTYDQPLRDEYVELDREAYTANNYAVTAFVGAGVAGAAAATFFLLHWKRSQDDSTTDTAPVVPTVTGNSVGLSTGWRF